MSKIKTRIGWKHLLISLAVLVLCIGLGAAQAVACTTDPECDDNDACTWDFCDTNNVCVNFLIPNNPDCCNIDADCGDDGKSCTDDGCVNNVCAAPTNCVEPEFCNPAGDCAIPTISSGPVTGRLLLEAGSYFCMNSAFPTGTCVPLQAGLDASGVVLGKHQPQSLTPVVCANNGGGTGYGFDSCVGTPSSIAQPFGFFGSPTYITTNPTSWQSCITHDPPSAEAGADLGGGCLALQADLGGFEVYWNGSVFQQGPRQSSGVNLYATGQLCSDNSYELDWPAKIVGGPFSGVTGFWRLRGTLNTACADMICDDNNPCTANIFDPATCSCDFSSLKTCDDGNDCTDDTCDPLVCGGCVYTPNTAACTPANCFEGTTCSDGVCGTPIIMDCDDSNLCTEDSCNPANGLCRNINKTIMLCSDDNPCTTDACVPATGECTYTNNTSNCTGSDPCMNGDKCSGGVCVEGTTPKTYPPSNPLDDGNPCTDDTCNPLNGGKLYTANSASCTPADLLCFIGNTCADKVCGTPIVCDDNNICTTDSCAGGVCSYVAKADGASCSGNDACAIGDTCTGGVCGAGPYELNCNDWNVCTDDSCDTVTGCAHVNNTASCVPPNPCTIGTMCSGGVCGTPKDCDDNDACTTDTCNVMTGACVNTAMNCSDGNPCTDDVCTAGVCSNPNNTASCDDGLFCNGDETCSAGVCGASPGNPCSIVCNEVEDNCTCTLDADCNDSDMCTTDTCVAGICVWTAIIPLVCDDSNICTTDGCTADACTTTNNTLPCPNADYCDGTETCAGGSCVSSGDPCPPLICNETSDACECTLDAQCDDSDICTTDTCVTGLCQNTAVIPPACDDNNVCTDDGCTANACTNTDNTAACDDNDACTTSDTCAAGACVGGAAPSCDDSNVCTDDSCVPATGCVNANNTLSCDDNNLCTTGDICAGGSCTSTAKDCNDNDACTTDTCDAGTGCVNTDNGICNVAGDGDVNNDGAVNVNDALLALRIAAGIETATAEQKSRGDVAPLVSETPSPDGNMDIGDVVVILRRAVDLIPAW